MPLYVGRDLERVRAQAVLIAENGQRCTVEHDVRKEPWPYRVERLDIGEYVRPGDLRPGDVRVMSVHAVPATFAARRRTAA